MVRNNSIIYASNPHVADFIYALSATPPVPTYPLHMPFGYVRSHNAPHHINIAPGE